ncbi:hypothetical protein B4129_2191 [Bacillus safensis]|nr:hypothetical protein B4129_2191 [Bacillus safensis]
MRSSSHQTARLSNLKNDLLKRKKQFFNKQFDKMSKLEIKK